MPGLKSVRFAIACLITLLSWAVMPTAHADNMDYLRPQAIPAPADNQLNPARINLGKTLFFDPRLSGDNTLSCTSCHKPDKFWTDGPTTQDHPVQHTRSIPTLINSAYQNFYMWDGRARSLEQQALIPLASAVEMNQDIDILSQELAQVSAYPALFAQAYPGEGITIETIAKALASFQRSLVSSDSPFDQWLRGDTTAINPAAQRGFALFQDKANCTACHHGFNFSDGSFHNIGLADDKDPGRYSLLPVLVLRGAFKTPTLWNISDTAPYMHNDVYQSLAEVIEHYDEGGKTHTNIDPNMRALFLSAQEKADLLSFLQSLSSKSTRFDPPQIPE